jgi:hypothetical protein
MAHSSSDPSRMNQQRPHEGRGDDESWKTRPSTETTHDEGTNARVARERKVAENAPGTGQSPDEGVLEGVPTPREPNMAGPSSPDGAKKK